MSSPSSNLRQRASKATQPAAAPTPKQQQDNSQDELTTMDKLNFYFAQHIGLLICAVGIAIVVLGYDKTWVNNTALMLVSLAFCLVGLFFHEFRPYNAQQIMEEQMKAEAAQ